MSDKKPPTQYITLKPLQLCKDDLGQSDDTSGELHDLLEKQLSLSHKKIEMLGEIIAANVLLTKINAEIQDNQVMLDKLQGITHAGENKKVKPSTGQTWTHKWKGYDVKITYISRIGGVKVEEVATGQVDGFCMEVFLDWFSHKNNEDEL